MPPDSMWLASVTSSLQTSNCHLRSPSTPHSTLPVWMPMRMSTLNPVASLTNLSEHARVTGVARFHRRLSAGARTWWTLAGSLNCCCCSSVCSHRLYDQTSFFNTLVGKVRSERRKLQVINLYQLMLSTFPGSQHLPLSIQ